VTLPRRLLRIQLRLFPEGNCLATQVTHLFDAEAAATEEPPRADLAEAPVQVTKAVEVVAEMNGNKRY
jgi:hypothetical protein